MTLIVEDGTGLPTANAYVDVAYVDSYFALRGGTAWAALTQEVKESSIVQATDYIDLRWGRLFAGQPLTEEQALAFPRTVFVGVPEMLKKACCEYAVRASMGPLNVDPTYSAGGFQKISESVKLGPIEEKNGFASGSEAWALGYWRSYPLADGLIIPLLNSQSSRVIRNG